MGKSSSRKKNKKQELKQIRIIPPISKIKRAKLWFAKKWDAISTSKKIGGVIIIGTGLLTYIQLYDRFHPIKEKEVKSVSQKDKFKKENIDTGLLQGPLMFENYTPEGLPVIVTKGITDDSLPKLNGILLKDFKERGVEFRVGTNTLSFGNSILYKGITLASNDYCSCSGFNIFFGVKNDRLYVSVKFKDLNTAQLIGFIEFNKWRVYLPNLLDYDYDDERLQVRDKQGNIVFSLKYENYQNNKRPVVIMKGYFLTNDFIIVLNDETNNCFEKIYYPDWKKSALVEIEKTKSMF